MRKILTAALCAFPLWACGGSSNNTVDAGKPDAGDPAVVFGLQAGDCYEFSNTDSTLPQPALGVAVESDAATKIWFLPDGGSASVPARQLTYRQSGNLKMTDYLYVSGNNVLLLDRNVQGAEEIEYQPALIVARLPLKNADHLEQNDGGITEYGGDAGSGLQPYDFIFDVTEDTLATPANAAFDAFTYHYSGDASRLGSWSFVPGTGTVELSLQLPGDTSVPTYKLQNSRQLDAGDQSCGSTASP